MEYADLVGLLYVFNIC